MGTSSGSSSRTRTGQAAVPGNSQLFMLVEIAIPDPLTSLDLIRGLWLAGPGAVPAVSFALRLWLKSI